MSLSQEDANRMLDEWSKRDADQRRFMASMAAEIAVLRGALLAINEWHMPYRGFSFDNGSNGERDYFRSVARRALNWSAE